MSTSGEPISSTTVSQMDTTGISIEGVEKVKGAIDDWVKEINAVNTIATSQEIMTAVKGTEREAQVKNLCTTAEAKINELVAKLTQYKSVLDNVKAAYKSQDNSTSAAISDVMKTIKS